MRSSRDRKPISTSAGVLPENLIEHNFEVMTGVPVAVVVKAAGFLEHAM